MGARMLPPAGMCWETGSHFWLAIAHLASAATSVVPFSTTLGCARDGPRDERTAWIPAPAKPWHVLCECNAQGLRRSVKQALGVTSGEGSMSEFLTDVLTIRRRARRHMERGAVTEGYRADLPTVLRLLNEALATEIVC